MVNIRNVMVASGAVAVLGGGVYLVTRKRDQESVEEAPAVPVEAMVASVVQPQREVLSEAWWDAFVEEMDGSYDTWKGGVEEYFRVEEDNVYGLANEQLKWKVGNYLSLPELNMHQAICFGCCYPGFSFKLDGYDTKAYYHGFPVHGDRHNFQGLPIDMADVMWAIRDVEQLRLIDAQFAVQTGVPFGEIVEAYRGAKRGDRGEIESVDVSRLTHAKLYPVKILLELLAKQASLNFRERGDQFELVQQDGEVVVAYSVDSLEGVRVAALREEMLLALGDRVAEVEEIPEAVTLPDRSRLSNEWWGRFVELAHQKGLTRRGEVPADAFLCVLAMVRLRNYGGIVDDQLEQLRVAIEAGTGDAKQQLLEVRSATYGGLSPDQPNKSALAKLQVSRRRGTLVRLTAKGWGPAAQEALRATGPRSGSDIDITDPREHDYNIMRALAGVQLKAINNQIAPFNGWVDEYPEAGDVIGLWYFSNNLRVIIGGTHVTLPTTLREAISIDKEELAPLVVEAMTQLAEWDDWRARLQARVAEVGGAVETHARFAFNHPNWRLALIDIHLCLDKGRSILCVYPRLIADSDVRGFTGGADGEWRVGDWYNPSAKFHLPQEWVDCEPLEALRMTEELIQSYRQV